MINPTKTAARVESDGLVGERREFTIKATGKAFRTLVDGLYENKVGAVVREIISNGYDSHAAAGTPEVPLSITAPTTMDPTFRVRDFGVSMDHETIMDLYSQLFNSTKEETNEQVGMFGLGSKSPFAYTDTFSVTSWLNGEKRVYVAHISDDDLPQITHIVTEPQGDEATGIEVAVPVKPHDVPKFHHEITRMVFASDVRPEVDGLAREIPEPMLDQPTFRIIEDKHNLGRVAVRQGCVIYPVHSSYCRHIQYGYTLIVDVPIGTLQVTASRESLSLDGDTQSKLNDLVAKASDDVQEWIDSIEFENRLDAFRSQNKYRFLTSKIGRGVINLIPDKKQDVPAASLKVMSSKRKWTEVTYLQAPRSIKLLVEREGDKIKRRSLRLGDFWETHGGTIAVVSPEEVPRLVRLLGLKKEQVLSITSIPDVEVERAPRGSGSGRSAAKRKGLQKGQYWVPKIGASTIDGTVLGLPIKTTTKLLDHNTNTQDYSGWRSTTDPGLRNILALVGIKPEQVVFYTDKQAEQFKAPASKMLEVELIKRLTKWAKDNDLQTKLDGSAEYHKYRSWADHGRVNQTICSTLGVAEHQWHRNREQEFVVEAASEAAQIALQELAPNLQELSHLEDFVSKALKMEAADPKLTNEEMETTVVTAVSHLTDLAKQDNPLRFLMKFYLTNNNNTEDESK